MTTSRQVVIAGAGPAGLALAVTLARTGLGIRCFDSRADAPWANNYGIWADDLKWFGDAGRQGLQWNRPAIIGADSRSYVVPSTYHMIPNTLLQAQWRTELQSLGGSLLAKRVVGVEARDGGVVCCTLDDGSEELADLFVDATGGTNPWIKRERSPTPGFQTAWGTTIRASLTDLPLQGADMALMDFRPASPTSPAWPPTFVYAFPTGPDTVFVEETVLVANPMVSPDELRIRLRERLHAWNLHDREELHHERCVIAMGDALPVASQPLLCWGASAGMVHPASGYSVGHTVRWAHEAAPAVAELLGTPMSASARQTLLWHQVWPRERRRAWRLYRFGMDVLLGMNAQELGDFFLHFFDCDADRALRFMRFDLSDRQLAELMMDFYRAVPASIRWRLTRAGMGPSGWGLAGRWFTDR
jgi:lycopene cyclase-like protein